MFLMQMFLIKKRVASKLLLYINHINGGLMCGTVNVHKVESNFNSYLRFVWLLLVFTIHKNTTPNYLYIYTTHFLRCSISIMQAAIGTFIFDF